MEKNKPQLRFKGFEEDWVPSKLGEIGDVKMCKRIFSNQTSTSDAIPFYKIGTFGKKADAFITPQLYKEFRDKYPFPNKGDILISASGTIGRTVVYDGKPAYFQDSNIVWLTNDESKVLNEFLYYIYGNITYDSEGGTIKRLYNNIILNARFTFPNDKAEQQKISSFIENLDKLIIEHQQKHTKLQALKKAMMVKLFPKQGQTVPDIRFKGFSGDWKEKELNELCSIITKQTGFDYSSTIKPSLTKHNVNNSYPFLQNKDFDGININLNTDFYIPSNIADSFPNILLDVTSILITISGKIGNVGLYQLNKKAFIGGAVGICKLKKKSSGLFILYTLMSDSGQSYFQSLVKASSHSNITVFDIRKIKILIPADESEVILIGKYFQKVDELIKLNEIKVDKLSNLKKAFLAKMFI